VLLAVELGQGLIGFVQYFTDLPVVLVGAHMLGACLVWLATLSVVWALRPVPGPPEDPPASREDPPASREDLAASREDPPASREDPPAVVSEPVTSAETPAVPARVR
jgi:cytochrome c oxidase assembly protein subunit 15